MKTVVARLEVMSSKVSFRWSLKTFRLRQLKATLEYVVGQDEVSMKPATLDRKHIQSTKPVEGLSMDAIQILRLALRKL